jgi:hypothetical protein
MNCILCGSRYAGVGGLCCVCLRIAFPYATVPAVVRPRPEVLEPQPVW